MSENLKIRKALLQHVTLSPRVAALFNKYGNDKLNIVFESEYKPNDEAQKQAWVMEKDIITVVVKDNGDIVWQSHK